MADIVNLRQARKQRARREKETKASENRRKFGRSKVETSTEEKERARSTILLDGHKLGAPDVDPSET